MMSITTTSCHLGLKPLDFRPTLGFQWTEMERVYFMKNIAISMQSTTDAVASRLLLWVYRPVLRKLMKLATMECLKEDTDAMVKFWSNWNEV